MASQVKSRIIHEIIFPHFLEMTSVIFNLHETETKLKLKRKAYTRANFQPPEQLKNFFKKSAMPARDLFIL